MERTGFSTLSTKGNALAPAVAVIGFAAAWLVSRAYFPPVESTLALIASGLAGLGWYKAGALNIKVSKIHTTRSGRSEFHASVSLNKCHLSFPRMARVEETLKAHNVELVSERLLLRCLKCGTEWSPKIPPGGRRLRKNYWKCPGCNDS